MLTDSTQDENLNSDLDINVVNEMEFKDAIEDSQLEDNRVKHIDDLFDYELMYNYEE